MSLNKNLQSRLISYEPLWNAWGVEEALYLHDIPHLYKISRQYGKNKEFALIEAFNVDCNAFASANLSVTEVKQRLIDTCNNMVNNNHANCKNIVEYNDYIIRDVYSDNVVSSYDVILLMKDYNCLYSEIKNGTRLSQNEVYNILYDVSNALNTGYSMGMIHNNLNIQNILIDDEGIYHLSGFDIYRLASPNYDIYQSQINDIFSIGVLSYQLLDTTYAFQNTPLNMLPPINGVNNQLMQIILKACQNTTTTWYTSTKQFFRDIVSLESVLFGTNSETRIPVIINNPSNVRDSKESTLVPAEEASSSKGVLRAIPWILLCLVLLFALVLFGIKIVDTLSASDSKNLAVANNSLNDTENTQVNLETSEINAIEYADVDVTSTEEDTPETETVPPIETTVTTTQPVTEATTIQEIEVPNISKKYYVVEGNYTWDEANYSVYNSGHELATFANEEEWNELLRVAEIARVNDGIKYFWIGGLSFITYGEPLAQWAYHEEENSSLYASYVKWFVNKYGEQEPSGYDRHSDEQTVENYLMLWYIDGWSLCDNSDDAVKNYSGKIGYIYMDN